MQSFPLRSPEISLLCTTEFMNAQHPIQPGEAQEALQMMEASERDLRSLETRDVGGYFLIWGVVYTLAPLIVLYLPHQAPWASVET